MTNNTYLSSVNKQEPIVVTFGCRLNAYESDVIKTLIPDSTQQTIVINTCAVTNEAERQARQSIRKLRRQYPDGRLIVTGCAAQINPKRYADMAEVNLVIGNDLKMQAESYKILTHHDEKIHVNDIMSVRETASHLSYGFHEENPYHARAFVQVQNGCNHRCTFCVIPYGRGNSRSIPIGEIVNQIQHLQDYSEIVLTGVDLTSYGEDLPGKPTLGQMIKRVLALLPSLKRLRLSSVDCSEIDEDLWDIIAHDKRFMPHLHLSLQAGDDMILKRMKRRHLRQDAIETCLKAKQLRPDIVLGADLIAGFPTETEAMFQNTLNLIDDCELTYLHIFPYSPRPNTPAARMPKVEPFIAKARAAQLRERGMARQTAFFEQFVGHTVPVLIEKVKDTTILGKTDQFVPVEIPLKNVKNPDSFEKNNPYSRIIYVNINENYGTHLTGNLL